MNENEKNQEMTPQLVVRLATGSVQVIATEP